jgi:WD40 repeat protein
MIPRCSMVILAACWMVPGLHAQPPVKPLTDCLGDPLPSGAVARLGTLRFKHAPAGDPTIDVAIFSPDGSKIASLVYGQATIRLWDAGSGQEIRGPWRNADRRYTAVAFTPDGASLVAAASPRNGPGNEKPSAPNPTEFILYDIAGAKVVKVLAGQPNLVRALTFADADKTLVAAGDGVVSWWDLATGKELRSWKPFADEQQPAANGGTKTKSFSECALAPDARSIAVHVAWRNNNNGPQGNPRNEPVEHEALGFDLATKQMIWRGKAKRLPHEMSCFAFSADSRRVAVAMTPDKVEVRDTTTGKLVGDPLASKFQGSSSWLGGLALSSDGTTAALAGGDSHVIVWKCDGTTQPRKFVARIAQYWPNSTKCLQFSSDSRMLLVGADADLQLYDLATFKEMHPWEGHRGWIDYLAFSVDGKRLLSGSADLNFHAQELAAWNPTTWKRELCTSLRAPPWPKVGVVSPEQSVYVGKDGDDRFGLYDLSSGKRLSRLAVPKEQSVQARGFFSPSGRYYLLAGRVDKDKNFEGLYEIPSGKLLAQLPPLSVQRSVMESARPIAFSLDDRLIALVAREDGMIHVIDAATGKLRHRLGQKMSLEPRPGEGIPVANLTFSNDGTLLASWFSTEIAVRVWDVATGVELLQVGLAEPASKSPGPPGQRRVRFAFSPDRRMLAVGEKHIQLWELATVSVRREFVGHPDAPVRALAFSPGGHVLASGSADTTVLIWDMSLPGRLPPSPVALERDALLKRWQALAESDAAKAFAAICDLAAAPLESVAWIKDQLKPAEPIDVKRIEELIRQLEANQYKVRQKATADLLEIGELAVPMIDQVLAGNPPLETRLRLQDLRKRMTSLALSGTRLQSFRAIEVLERIGTSEARAVLQTLAGGATAALVTTQAQETLLRLPR